VWSSEYTKKLLKDIEETFKISMNEGDI